jgi:hypothetical protein
MPSWIGSYPDLKQELGQNVLKCAVNFFNSFNGLVSRQTTSHWLVAPFFKVFGTSVPLSTSAFKLPKKLSQRLETELHRKKNPEFVCAPSGEAFTLITDILQELNAIAMNRKCE